MCSPYIFFTSCYFVILLYLHIICPLLYQMYPIYLIFVPDMHHTYPYPDNLVISPTELIIIDQTERDSHSIGQTRSCIGIHLELSASIQYSLTIAALLWTIPDLKWILSTDVNVTTRLLSTLIFIVFLLIFACL